MYFEINIDNLDIRSQLYPL